MMQCSFRIFALHITMGYCNVAFTLKLIAKLTYGLGLFD